MQLTAAEIAELRRRYYYLTSYGAAGSGSPIDPLTYQDCNGDHLLHIAAHAGDVRSVELLLNAGIDIDLAGDMGCTALHYATQAKHHALTALLLARGASASVQNDFGQLPGEA